LFSGLRVNDCRLPVVLQTYPFPSSTQVSDEEHVPLPQSAEPLKINNFHKLYVKIRKIRDIWSRAIIGETNMFIFFRFKPITDLPFERKPNPLT